MVLKNSFFSIVIFMLLFGCSSDDSSTLNTTGFTLVDSGIDFSNNLDEKNLKSVFNYINVYAGSGVAIGDINNDGLQDIYFGGNMSSSKLYLNKGDLKFEDITSSSGTATDYWVTAVTMADVNNDGWLDIYVCRSYHDQIAERANLLFINNKDNTFSERASEFGIADGNYSIASAFFDYDNDGDLDLFVGNHPRYRALDLSTHYNYWLNPVDEFTNNLYRNDGNKFTRVTREAGLMAYGFTLGVITSDYDLDGWADIFVTVDHDEPDVVYHNNGDGTFSKVTNQLLSQTSLSSMGIDAGDINHDKYPDYIVAEMLSEDHYREKVNMSMSNVKRFEYLVDSLGYRYYQMHNYLHLNNGNNTFSDISQMAGVHKSDWSWSTLFMDYDQDGWLDIYVTNGLYKEVFNRDRKGMLDSVMIALNGDMAKMNQIATDYSLNTPQTKVQNYLFKGNSDLTFEKYSDQANLTQKTISTGAAYGDLDNDGDLDIVVNNTGEKAFVYRNNLNKSNYIRIGFEHGKVTPVGSKVYLYNGDDVQTRELLLTRGFLSSSEPFVHFGLGDVMQAEKLEIIWPNGHKQVLKDIKAGTTIMAKIEDAKERYSKDQPGSLLEDISAKSLGLDYVQEENYYFDYADQVLLPHRMSEYGPFMEVADFNNDKLDDVVISSPKDQSTAIYLQTKNGDFNRINVKAFETDKAYEDGQIAVFDANGDGFMDLCIGSTGYQFEEGSPMYQTRLYLGNGKGDFIKQKEAFKDYSQSTSCIKVSDIDGDGDLDIFLGGRDRPKKYPQPPASSIWKNDGKGVFTNVTKELAPALSDLGMVRDAIWSDLNGDKVQDLIIVGEWMSITMMINENGLYVDKTSEMLKDSPSGWWNTIAKSDLDGDGLDDYIIGNLGYNYKYKASKDKPFLVYSEDFDKSGSQDIVLGTYYGDQLYPVRGKNCSSEQIPDLEKKFATYEQYANANIIDVYGDALNSALKYEVNEFGSIILFQKSPGIYEYKLLPKLAQRSPINAITIEDINKDGKPDIVVAGNLYQSEIETGRADAGIGTILINKGNKEFVSMPTTQSGFYASGDVKSMKVITIKGKKVLIIGKNKDKLQLVSIK